MKVINIASLLSFVVFAKSSSLREDIQQHLNTGENKIPLVSSQITAELPPNFDGGSCTPTTETEAIGCYIYNSDVLFGIPLTTDFTGSVGSMRSAKTPQSAFSRKSVINMIQDGCFAYNTDLYNHEAGNTIQTLNEYTKHKARVFGASAEVPIKFGSISIDIGFSMRNSKTSLRSEKNDIQTVLISRKLNHGTFRNSCLKSICEDGKRCVDAYVNPAFKTRFLEVAGNGVNINTIEAERLDLDFGYFFPTEFKIGDAYEYEYVSNTSSLTEQEVNDFKMQSSLNIKLGLSANDLEMKFANNMSRTSNETSYMSRVASSSKIYHKFMRGCDYTTTTVDGITKNAEEDIKSKCADAFEENILDWPTPYSASKFVTATDLFSVDSKVHLNYRTAVAEGYFPCEEIPKNSSISFYSQHDEGDVPTLDIPVEQYFDRFSLMDDCFTVDDLLVNGEQRFKCCVLKRDCYLSDVALPKGLKMTLYNLPDRNSNWEERCELGSKPLVVTGKSDKRKVSVWAKDRADRMCAGRVELQTGYSTQCYTYLD